MRPVLVAHSRVRVTRVPKERGEEGGWGRGGREEGGGGVNKRNKHHRLSVLQQQRGGTGLTMPEPVPAGMHALFVKSITHLNDF